MVGVTTVKEISKVWDGIMLAAATKNKLNQRTFGPVSLTWVLRIY